MMANLQDDENYLDQQHMLKDNLPHIDRSIDDGLLNLEDLD